MLPFAASEEARIFRHFLLPGLEFRLDNLIPRHYIIY